MLTIATVHEQDNQLVKAYMLYMRVAMLVLEGLPEHKSYNDASVETKTAKTWVRWSRSTNHTR